MQDREAAVNGQLEAISSGIHWRAALHSKRPGEADGVALALTSGLAAETAQLLVT
jgi:hypothetical protein